MIGALMLYSITVSIFMAAAAVATERLLRLSFRPARWVWVAAMGATIGFSTVQLRSAAAPPAGPALDPAVAPGPPASDVRRELTPASDATPGIGQSPSGASVLARAIRTRVNAMRIPVAAGSTWTQLDQPLLIAWLASSILGLLLIGVAALRLARPRPRWTTAIVDGVPVLLSHDLGPAVIGLFRYRIVLPRWVLALPPAERDLVLVHEREHAAACDPSLLFVATLLMALCPWNVPLWWMARRLRFAIELDCDARVLRSRPDRCAYGALLIDVSERTLGGAMPIAALAEPVSLIERRIVAMSNAAPRLAFLRSIAAGTCAAALVAIACASPRPMAVASPSHAARSTTSPPEARLGTSSHRTPASTAPRTRYEALSDETINLLLRYGTAGIVNPMLMILRDAESLGLSARQADSVATLNRLYRVRLDGIWSPVAQYYVGRPSVDDRTATTDRYSRAPDATIDLLMAIAPQVIAVLNEDQRSKLPIITASYLDPKNLAAIRGGTAGASGGIFLPFRAPGGGRGARGRVGGGM